MNLPNNILLPFDNVYEPVMRVGQPLFEGGVDFSALVNDCLDIIGQYTGVTATNHDFHGIPYYRFEECFDTYCYNVYGGSEFMNHDQYDKELEFFHEAYGYIVERIYLNTHQYIEELESQYGASLIPNLRFDRFINNDLKLRTF